MTRDDMIVQTYMPPHRSSAGPGPPLSTADTAAVPSTAIAFGNRKRTHPYELLVITTGTAVAVSEWYIRFF